MQIDYIEQNTRNIIKYEPIINVYNNNYSLMARYDSNRIKRIQIDEACHEKNCANVGNFIGRLMDLSFRLDRTNLDLSAFIYSLEMYYLDDENLILYDANDNEQPIGLTYDDDLYAEDVENLGSDSPLNYTWSKIGIGNFYPTDIKYNRDTKCYELELTDIPPMLNSVSPEVVLSVDKTVRFDDMLNLYIPTALDVETTGINFNFECDSDIEYYEFEYTKDLKPSIRELIANIAFAMNSNARMEYVDLSEGYVNTRTMISIRRFGTNEYQEHGVWSTDNTPVLNYEKIDDYYFEQSAPYQDYLYNITLEASGEKLTFSNWAYGSLNIKNRLWKDELNIAVRTIHNPRSGSVSKSILDHLQSWEYKGEALFHLRAGDKIQIENEFVYIGQITNSWEEGVARTTMQQKLLTNGDTVMIQVNSDQEYNISPYTPPVPDITDFSDMTLPGLQNAFRDYYNGTKTPTVTPSKITWENGTEWNLGDTIDIPIAAIPPTQNVSFSHAANTLTFKIVGINHDTITGTNTKALVSLWCCTPYLDSEANLPYNADLGTQYTRHEIQQGSWEHYNNFSLHTDWQNAGWYSQAQMTYVGDYDTSGIVKSLYSNNVLDNWLNTVFISALPTEIQNSLQSVNKTHIVDCQYYSPDYTVGSYKVFNLAEVEILGTNYNSDGYSGNGGKYGAYHEGEQYKYFENNQTAAMIQLGYDWRTNPIGVYCPYWLRTMPADPGPRWCCTNSTWNGTNAEFTTYSSGSAAMGIQPVICL